MKIWQDGEILDKDQARVSVYDHGLLYGDGVFEGIRVYNGRIFQAEAHLRRLFESAQYIRLQIPYTPEQLHEAMEQTIRADDRRDGYIRLVVTRGMGTLGLNPFLCVRPCVFCIVDDIALYPPEMYEDGMHVIIAKTVRCGAEMLPPSVKSLNYLNNTLAKIEAIDAGAPEAFMRNAKGDLAEATGDNVFIVEAGRIITPPPEAGMLLGITRGVVKHLAGQMGLDLAEDNIRDERLYAAEECFLSGTAAEVIAVTQVDGLNIGDGSTGPVTRKLQSAFREFIDSGQTIPYP